MGVKNVFFHGKIDWQPERYEDGSDRVCKLVNALKQSPRVWYKALNGVLLMHGFVKSIDEMALYFKDGVKGGNCGGFPHGEQEGLPMSWWARRPIGQVGGLAGRSTYSGNSWLSS